MQTEAKVGHEKSHLKTLCAQISEAAFTSEASWAEGHPGGHVPWRTVTVKGGSSLNREAPRSQMEAECNHIQSPLGLLGL